MSEELQQTPLPKSWGGNEKPNEKIVAKRIGLNWLPADKTFGEEIPQWAIDTRTTDKDLSRRERYAHHINDAKDRVSHIRYTMSVLMDSYQTVAQNLAEAWTQRDYLSLGYPTWQEYAEGEFGSSLVKMTAEMRAEFTPLLRALGMPTGAIAAIEGVDRKTVQRDEKPVVQATAEPTATNVAVEPDEVTYEETDPSDDNEINEVTQDEPESTEPPVSEPIVAQFTVNGGEVRSIIGTLYKFAGVDGKYNAIRITGTDNEVTFSATDSYSYATISVSATGETVPFDVTVNADRILYVAKQIEHDMLNVSLTATKIIFDLGNDRRSVPTSEDNLPDNPTFTGSGAEIRMSAKQLRKIADAVPPNEGITFKVPAGDGVAIQAVAGDLTMWTARKRLSQIRYRTRLSDTSPVK